MSFRRREVGLSGPQLGTKEDSRPSALPGVRPSPVDGRLTTSTGTQSLDDLFAGHAGLPLGNCVLLEEDGVTDFTGILLRYYGAEGVAQGHHVHVLGLSEQWSRTLPGLDAKAASTKAKVSDPGEKMKIAWRYERLGDFESSSRGAPIPNRAPLASPSSGGSVEAPEHVFRHDFDLTKSLSLTAHPPIHFVPISNFPSPASSSPLLSSLETISLAIEKTPPNMVHRIVIPSFLSPAFYHPQLVQPAPTLSFLLRLRALLSRYSTRSSCMISLSSSLFPPSTGFTTFIEHVVDGVLELKSFPKSAVDLDLTTTSSRSEAKSEMTPMGLLKIRKLPVVTDRGAGTGAKDDMAFSLGRKKFVLMPYHLPPADAEPEQPSLASGTAEAKIQAKDMEF